MSTLLTELFRVGELEQRVIGHGWGSVVSIINNAQPSRCTTRLLQRIQLIQPGIEGVQTLADISHSRYAVIATKPVHRLPILPIVHN